MREIQYGILHNRKTGGTALKEMIAEQARRTSQMNVLCFDHSMTLPLFLKQYPEAKAVFFIRDPISRFISGFYSRLRMGKPRYHYPWSSAEERAFKRFQHPNLLAEALSSRNIVRRCYAISAMKSIGHVRHHYSDFLGEISFLESIADRIAFIGHQQAFDQDFNHLRPLLMIDNDIMPPKDVLLAHRNPDELDKELSAIAITNLKKWYRTDFEIYSWCLERRKIIITLLPESPGSEGSLNYSNLGIV